MPLYKGQINSSVYLTAGNGYGSTNTKIRRFTNSTVVGTDLTYADSATLGSSITVNVSGTYAINRNDFCAGANADVGVSVNSSELTTNIQTITAANRVCVWEMPTTGASFSNGGCSRARYFDAGDVIRPHDAIANTDTGVYSWLSVTRVS